MQYSPAMHLHQAMLFVKDFNRAAAFYSEVLGLTPIAATRTDSWLEFPGFSLHAIPPHIAADIEIADPPAAREDYPTKLIFAVPNVEVECDRLRSLGVNVQMRPWGACDVIDPEGNILQLCTPA